MTVSRLVDGRGRPTPLHCVRSTEHFSPAMNKHPLGHRTKERPASALKALRQTGHGHSPSPLTEVVRRNMRTMPTRNSSPEVRLRRILHRFGLRYRLHSSDLPGRPDITFSSAKVVVFVDGCFWHACPTHGVLPKNNREWWRRKLLMNRKRDRDKDRVLKSTGWLPIHVWEHDEMASAARKIAQIVRGRRNMIRRT